VPLVVLVTDFFFDDITFDLFLLVVLFVIFAIRVLDAL